MPGVDLHPVSTDFPFFLITDSAVGVMFGDYLRVGLLIVGVMLAAASVHAVYLADNLTYRVRGTTMTLFIVSVAGTEYIRLGDPVTTRLVINCLAVMLAAWAFRLGAFERPVVKVLSDVRPTGTGTWVATCECGRSMERDTVESGWSWMLEHPCSAAR